MALELDDKNIKAHLLAGQNLCMIAKEKNSSEKIDTGIQRILKGKINSIMWQQEHYVLVKKNQILKNKLTMCSTKLKNWSGLFNLKKNKKRIKK